MRGRRSERRTGGCPNEPATPTPLRNVEGNRCYDNMTVPSPPIFFPLPPPRSLPLRRHDRPPPGYYPQLTAGLPHRVPAINRSPPSIAVAVTQPGPLHTTKPSDDTPYRKRCLRGKADFAGSAQLLANTAFAARAAIVAVVR